MNNHPILHYFAVIVELFQHDTSSMYYNPQSIRVTCKVTKNIAECKFGTSGNWYYQIARGIERPVQPKP